MRACHSRALVRIAVLSVACAAQAYAAEETLLLREPTIGAQGIVFRYADDLWTVGQEGGEARRLTTHAGTESGAAVSPDGRWVAFTASYGGNPDVYVVPFSGGEPRRLTWHPEMDGVIGWTPDGERVLFTSARLSGQWAEPRLFAVPLAGGYPEPLPVPAVHEGRLAPDGRRLAYGPISYRGGTWKRYRGGTTSKIWIFDLASRALTRVPRENSNDHCPRWVGEEVWFLSDRDRVMNLYAFRPATGAVRRVTRHEDFDVKWADGGAGRVVYEQGGRIHLLDPATGATRPLAIHAATDLVATMPAYRKIGDDIRAAVISPNGKRALFEARGEILSVPREKGDPRNLTRTPAVHDRAPAWSPDGRRVAWLSDAAGEYDLYIADQKGETAPQRVDLPDRNFYYAPVWSPSNQAVALSDKQLALWIVDVESGRTTLVDRDTYDSTHPGLPCAWSPDGRWLAYARRLPTGLRAVFLHSLDTGTSHQVTDGLSDATEPVFDRSGRYLYFAASTDYALRIGWLDMTSFDRPTERSLYLVVLRAEDPSPLLPESDEEEGAGEEKAEKESGGSKDAKASAEDGEKNAEKNDKGAETRVDLAGIERRILALDVTPGPYSQLSPAGEKCLLYLADPEEGETELRRYDLKKREEQTILAGIQSYEVAAGGEHLLYHWGDTWGIVEIAENKSPGDGSLDLEDLAVQIVPVEEWRQIYEESWRLLRDFFYDPQMHGVDWEAMRERYRPFLAHVRHRADLTHLLRDLHGELCVGHLNLWGGDQPELETVAGGLLGADLVVEHGRYRLARILTGESWNPDLRAPLAAPGIDVHGGDYLIAIDGVDLAPPDNPHRLLEAKADRQVVIVVAADPEGRTDRRTVTVVPVESEFDLRQRAWVEDNRRRVDELSGGRLAYVWLPNTGQGGYRAFNRYFYSQIDRQGAIIDERFNGGGSVADYIVDLLDRPLLNWWITREGRPFPSPIAALYGPKVMVVNEYAGSGGDWLPRAFRLRGIGPIVGMRTWGGLVGIYNFPVLLDGGYITTPRMAIWSAEGGFVVENEGVPPDIEVEQTPAEVLAGQDPQLERAVEEALRLLETGPPPPQPPSDVVYPDRS